MLQICNENVTITCDLTVITYRKLTSGISKYFSEHMCEMIIKKTYTFLLSRVYIFIYIAFPIYNQFDIIKIRYIKTYYIKKNVLISVLARGF